MLDEEALGAGLRDISLVPEEPAEEAAHPGEQVRHGRAVVAIATREAEREELAAVVDAPGGA